jgi:hypothetical protein
MIRSVAAYLPLCFNAFAYLIQLEQSNIALRKTNAKLQAANSQTVSTVNEVADQTQALAAQVDEQADASSWADKIGIKGDFRYRMENIQETGKSDRDRQRIRARAAIIATPQEGLEVGLGIASGDDDPLTTNQTLGGGSSTKGLNLDLAYFSWSGQWQLVRKSAGFVD